MYLVLESILFALTEGCSWRAIDRPQARWNSVYQYFRRWCQRGTLQRVLTQFGPELAPGWHFVDSTHGFASRSGQRHAQTTAACKYEPSVDSRYTPDFLDEQAGAHGTVPDETYYSRALGKNRQGVAWGTNPGDLIHVPTEAQWLRLCDLSTG
jgi:Putative transposase of IS4/5 family (DUF4096)